MVTSTKMQRNFKVPPPLVRGVRLRPNLTEVLKQAVERHLTSAATATQCVHRAGPPPIHDPPPLTATSSVVRPASGSAPSIPSAIFRARATASLCSSTAVSAPPLTVHLPTQPVGQPPLVGPPSVVPSGRAPQPDGHATDQPTTLDMWRRLPPSGDAAFVMRFQRQPEVGSVAAAACETATSGRAAPPATTSGKNKWSLVLTIIDVALFGD